MIRADGIKTFNKPEKTIFENQIKIIPFIEEMIGLKDKVKKRKKKKKKKKDKG